MESLGLLRYWRGGGGPARAASTPAAAAASSPEPPAPVPEVADGEEREDEGPFFDIEFTVPDARGGESGGGGDNEDDKEGSEGEKEDFDFSMTSEESEFRSMSPSDDLFFKGRLIPLEANSIVISAGQETDPKTQLAVSLMKSATRFRVFILGLRKPKSPAAAEPNAAGVSAKQFQQPSKFFFVKFKVEEVPIVSLFTRDGSSRNLVGGSKVPPKLTDGEGGEEAATIAPPAPEEKKPNSKEVVHKYLSKIKPLYIRVSKRYADKLRSSDPLPHGSLPPEVQLSPGEEKEPEQEEQIAAKMAEKAHKIPMPAMLRVVYERLGKSRSSSPEAGSTSPPQRRDDSLLQQQDGIQSAIAHCKRSFTATSKESESPLVSDPGADGV